MAYQYNPQPGPPLDPSKYNGAVGPNGQRYGEQQGFVYNPVTDKYDPKPKEDKKQGLGNYIGPVAAGAGAIAAGTILGNPEKWPAAGAAIKDSVSGVGHIFGMGAPETATTATSATSAAPAAASAAAPTFSLGAQSASAAPSLASSVPFSFEPGSAAAGAAPTAASGTAPGAPVMVDALYDGAPASVAQAGAPAANMFGVYGGLGPALGVAGQAYYYGQQGLHAYDEFKDEGTRDQGAIRAGLMTNPMTAWIPGVTDALGIKLGGHGKNYYAAKDREHIWDKLTGGTGVLTFERADGTPYSITKEQFAKSQDAYNYDQSSESMPLDIGVGNTAATLLGFKPGSKMFTDMAGAMANAHRNGVNPDQVFGKLGLPTGHDQLYGQIILDEKAGKISKEHADQAKNALDQVFQVGFYAGGKSPEKASGPSANINPVVSSPAPSSGGGAVKPVSTGPQRVSPGVYKDAQGTFNSKTGVRGK